MCKKTKAGEAAVRAVLDQTYANQKKAKKALTAANWWFKDLDATKKATAKKIIKQLKFKYAVATETYNAANHNWQTYWGHGFFDGPPAE